MTYVQFSIVFSTAHFSPYLCPKKARYERFSFIPPTSVVTIPGTHASAAFTSKTSEVFKEEHNIAPIIINDKMKYIPWGGDNHMPYNIIDLIESDETMSTCQMFNAEVCYGSGLVYDTELATAQVQAQVDDFMLDNDLASYLLGVCQDFKHFGFCVSVIILNEDASRIGSIGSDKRELYTIAQALQKPYHDILFSVHRLIIRFNKWTAVKPDCPFIQLTTLDENKDAKQVSLNKPKDNEQSDK